MTIAHVLGYPRIGANRELKTATEALMTSSQGFAQRMYEAAAQEAATEGDSETVADDDIVDAEIIEEDE